MAMPGKETAAAVLRRLIHSKCKDLGALAACLWRPNTRDTSYPGCEAAREVLPQIEALDGLDRDIGKLREAQLAIDRLPDGADKAALTHAVLQWMHVAFIDHRPLSPRDMAWAREVADRARPPRGDL